MRYVAQRRYYQSGTMMSDLLIFLILEIRCLPPLEPQCFFLHKPFSQELLKDGATCNDLEGIGRVKLKDRPWCRPLDESQTT